MLISSHIISYLEHSIAKLQAPSYYTIASLFTSKVTFTPLFTVSTSIFCAIGIYQAVLVIYLIKAYMLVHFNCVLILLSVYYNKAHCQNMHGHVCDLVALVMQLYTAMTFHQT